MILQRTLKSSVKAIGVGVHTGHKVTLVLRPAAPDTGIVFCRSDLPGNPAIPARAHNVVDTRMATVLEKDGARVSTVEHLMSAFFGLGVDNAYVYVSAEEVPIMDGSAATFVFLLQQAGVEEQAAPKKYLRVLKTLAIEQGDKRVSLSPFSGFKVGFAIEFRHPVFEQSETTVDIDFGEVSFVKEVARARTFGFTQDVEAMRNAGLGRGGSLDNAIVVDDLDSQRIYEISIGRSQLTYQLNRYLFFRGTVEYNTYRRKLLTDLLASFTCIPGTVLHVGYGSAHERIRWQGDAYLPDARLLETQRAFFLKASYLWQM